MAQLRADVEAILVQLLAASAATGTIALDAIGDALGSLAVSTDDIDGLLSALEDEKRAVTTPTGASAEEHLKRVVVSARTLKLTLARRPTLSEVASQAGLTEQQALLGLALLRIMQR